MNRPGNGSRRCVRCIRPGPVAWSHSASFVNVWSLPTSWTITGRGGRCDVGVRGCATRSSISADTESSSSCSASQDRARRLCQQPAEHRGEGGALAPGTLMKVSTAPGRRRANVPFSSEPLEPFLKWPGGKRWAAEFIADIIRPLLRGRYFEPFLGGGAVYFHLRPRSAILSDINGDLIGTYRTVRRAPHAILRALGALHVSKRDYYRVRRTVPRRRVDQAARFLYLNRTAFAGIYRLNKQGYFNVPYAGGGRGTELLCGTDRLVLASRALRRAAIEKCDFQEQIDRAIAGDVVYCDPAYTVAHDRNCFVRYNEQNFSWADQERLAQAAIRAGRRGATVLVSNAHHPSVRQLYPDAVVSLERTSRVSPDVQRRGPVRESLFILSREPYDPPVRRVRLRS